jgi:hypothetical protein
MELVTLLTDDIGITTVSPPSWLTSFDLERWSNNGLEAPPTSRMRWEFENRQRPCEPSSLTFSVIYATGGPTHTFHIHRNLMLMLGYLDLDYWLSPMKVMTVWNRNRISRYLQRLREDVVVELTGVEANVLEDSTFGTNALREWAVRVHGGYGHSQTGRKEYQESCKRRGVTPYDEDFINYGKSQASYDTTHLMKTSDWRQMCKHHFAGSISHRSLLPCPTRVHSLCADHRCNVSVTCAATMTSAEMSLHPFCVPRASTSMRHMGPGITGQSVLPHQCRYKSGNVSTQTDWFLFTKASPPKYARKITIQMDGHR